MAANLAKFCEILFLILAVISEIMTFKLTQVVILGRHGVRTPFYNYPYETYTPKTWPKWKEQPSYLTAKGFALEANMGEYFSSWLRENKLFGDVSCPDNNSVFIYTNAKQRTKETGKAFASTCFKDCNITVHHRKDVDNDPMFNAVIHNKTDSFKRMITNEMQERLKKTDLNKSYLLLNKILDFNNSKLCKENSFCDLSKEKNIIILKAGAEPRIEGPLNIGNHVVDFFLMCYYDGMPMKNIAWGSIKPEFWPTLTRILKEHLNIRYNSPKLGKDVASPLLNIIYEEFIEEKHEFTLLVGHDSNLNSVFGALEFEPFELPKQYEISPVGSKLVFQKWHDELNNRYLLKIEYVYQTTEQLRQGTKLSLEHPPGSIKMELKNCKTDENGFCPWDDFLDLLEALQ